MQYSTMPIGRASMQNAKGQAREDKEAKDKGKNKINSRVQRTTEVGEQPFRYRPTDINRTGQLTLLTDGGRTDLSPSEIPNAYFLFA